MPLAVPLRALSQRRKEQRESDYAQRRGTAALRHRGTRCGDCRMDSVIVASAAHWAAGAFGAKVGLGGWVSD